MSFIAHCQGAPLVPVAYAYHPGFGIQYALVPVQSPGYFLSTQAAVHFPSDLNAEQLANQTLPEQREAPDSGETSEYRFPRNPIK